MSQQQPEYPQPRSYRFEPYTLRLLDALQAHLGFASRTEVLRHALTRLAREEGLLPPAEKIPEK